MSGNRVANNRQRSRSKSAVGTEDINIRIIGDGSKDLPYKGDMDRIIAAFVDRGPVIGSLDVDKEHTLILIEADRAAALMASAEGAAGLLRQLATLLAAHQNDKRKA